MTVLDFAPTIMTFAVGNHWLISRSQLVTRLEGHTITALQERCLHRIRVVTRPIRVCGKEMVSEREKKGKSDEPCQFPSHLQGLHQSLI